MRILALEIEKQEILADDIQAILTEEARKGGVFQSTSGEIDFTGHYVLLFWCIVFVPIALLFMRYFKEGQRL